MESSSSPGDAASSFCIQLTMAWGWPIHEWPTPAEGGRATLETGMTVTVEPGVYLAGVGGVRIGDTILVTASGPPHILTSSPYDLTVL